MGGDLGRATRRICATECLVRWTAGLPRGSDEVRGKYRTHLQGVDAAAFDRRCRYQAEPRP
jgi:hypothetical protein